MNPSRIWNGAKHLHKESSISEELKEGAKLAAKREEYKLAPALRVILDKAVGELSLLEKLANRGSVGRGDLEIYKATTRSLCKELKKRVKKVALSDEEDGKDFEEVMDRKLNELSELVDAIDENTGSIVATIKNFEVISIQNHRTTTTMRESLDAAAR